MVFLNNERVPRDITTVPGFAPPVGTEPHVGPGSYKVTDCGGSGASKSGLPERFQGLEGRCASPNPGAAFIPGPGAYGAPAPPGAGVGGGRPTDVTRSAFRARGPKTSPAVHVPGATEFTVSTVLEVPGPGTYDISRDISTKPASQALRSPQDAPAERFPPLEVEVDGGALTDLPSTLGARTTDWSTSATDRSCRFDALCSGPGPGTYAVAKSLNSKAMDSAFRSRTLRGMKYETASPGPANYAEPPPAVAGSPDFSVGASSSFKSESKRGFGPGTTCSPGPGNYEVRGSPCSGTASRARSASTPGVSKFFGVHSPQHHALLRDTRAMPRCGFHSSEPKLPVARVEVQAGPGQYHCDARTLVANVRSKGGLGRQGVFGSRAPRMAQHRDEFSDPGAYFKDEPAPAAPEALPGFRQLRGHARQAPFGSSVPRIHGGGAEPQEACPGTYDWRDINKVDYRSKQNRPRTVSGAFGSTRERFAPRPESLEPGPGAYDPAAAAAAAARRRANAARSSPSARAQAAAAAAAGGDGEPPVGPDPGAYHTELRWVKKSFNVSHQAHAKRTLARVMSAAS